MCTVCTLYIHILLVCLLQTENQPRRQAPWEAAIRRLDGGDGEVSTLAAGQGKSAMHRTSHRLDIMFNFTEMLTLKTKHVDHPRDPHTNLFA